jgi:predicted RNA-binding protein associated with RNAse of E/G family
VRLSFYIRGIYSTALTELALINGASVVSPADAVARRFLGRRGLDRDRRANITVSDLDDRQGVRLEGSAAHVDMAASILMVFLFDAVFLQRGNGEVMDVLFPYMAKANLDELRARVTATIPRHHRLRIIASEQLDAVESPRSFRHPLDAVRAGRELERRRIWATFAPGNPVAFEQVGADGSILPLRYGEVVHRDFTKRKLWIQRQLAFEGPYRCLDANFHSGDYAITEMKEGAWFFRHAYFRADGRLIGSYYNINTMPEFYPGKVRYVDLGIDVVKAAEQEAHIANAASVDTHRQAGAIGHKLADTAYKTAHDIRDIADNQSTVPPFAAFTRGVRPVSRAETRVPR